MKGIESIIVSPKMYCLVNKFFISSNEIITIRMGAPVIAKKCSLGFL